MPARGVAARQDGPTGPAGPPGPTYTAAVTGLGEKVRGNSLGATAAASTSRSSAFPGTSTSACRRRRSQTSTAQNHPPGRITVARESGQVLVRTFNAAGDPQRLPFHLIVAC